MNNYNLANLARNGNYKMIKKILNSNPLHPVDNPDIHGKTAILYAAEINHLKMLKLLLDFGADPDHQDIDGNNALALAVKFESEITAHYLLDLGMDVNIKVNHNTLLQSAILNQNAPLTYKILKKGADPTIKNYKGLDAYELAQDNLESNEIPEFERILEKLNWI